MIWDQVLDAGKMLGVAGLALLGQRYVARMSKQANVKAAEVQERATEVEKKAADIEGMDKLVHNLETRLEKVEERAEKLAERVRHLEEERIKDKSLIRNLWAYVLTLRAALIRARQSIPEPPGGLDFDSPLA